MDSIQRLFRSYTLTPTTIQHFIVEILVAKIYELHLVWHWSRSHIEELLNP